MPIGAIIAMVIICVIAAAVAVAAGIQFSRRQALRRLFDQLDIRPLTPEQRARYEGEWTVTQERFVENPAQATQAAAALVIAVARDRGFSADDAVIEYRAMFRGLLGHPDGTISPAGPIRTPAPAPGR